jgi:hypothetical protein
MRFHVLTSASMKTTTFWVVSPCSPLQVYRRFGGACCFYQHANDGSSKHLSNVYKCPQDHTVQQSGRQPSSESVIHFQRHASAEKLSHLPGVCVLPHTWQSCLRNATVTDELKIPDSRLEIQKISVVGIASTHSTINLPTWNNAVKQYRNRKVSTQSENHLLSSSRHHNTNAEFSSNNGNEKWSRTDRLKQGGTQSIRRRHAALYSTGWLRLQET